MTCPNCTQAEAQPWHQFTAGCKGCEARMLDSSVSPIADKPTIKQTRYLAEAKRWRCTSQLRGLGVQIGTIVCGFGGTPEEAYGWWAVFANRELGKARQRARAELVRGNA